MSNINLMVDSLSSEMFAIGFRDLDRPYKFNFYSEPCSTIEEIEGPDYEPYFIPGQPHERCYIIYIDSSLELHIVAEWKNNGWVSSDGT
jgi:hypothetical protein